MYRQDLCRATGTAPRNWGIDGSDGILQRSLRAPTCPATSEQRPSEYPFEEGQRLQRREEENPSTMLSAFRGRTAVSQSLVPIRRDRPDRLVHAGQPAPSRTA